MNSVPRLTSLIAAAALGLALSACAASEPRPALVSQNETGGDYGYSEKKIADDLYEITYESPIFSVPVGSTERSRRLEQERQRAHDFALWRAAQLAKANGFSALVTEQDQRDVEVNVQTEPSPRLWPGFFGYRPYWYRRHPWALYDDDCCWPAYSDYQRWASAKAKVKLRVRFLKQPKEGALDVDKTLEHLSSIYGTPTYP